MSAIKKSATTFLLIFRIIHFNLLNHNVVSDFINNIFILLSLLMFTLLFLNTNFRDLMINNKINPIVNQFEITPFYQQHFAHDYTTTKGILTESWAPFAEGEKGLFQNPTLVEIANKYQHSVAQVVLCWLIQRGIIVIPKSVNPDRVEENFKVFDFELSTEDMKTIHSLDTVQSQFFSYHDPDQVERNSGLKLKD